MGISQSELARIVQEVADERLWKVEIYGTDVYLTYDTHKHTYRIHFDYNDGGEITGHCISDRVYPGDIHPDIFADMVARKIDDLIKGK